MTIENLKTFIAGAMNAGINVNAADIVMGLEAINILPLTKETQNVSLGHRTGISSRYGINPIPGHGVGNSPAYVIPSGAWMDIMLRNLIDSEQQQTAPVGFHATLDYYDRRRLILGAVIVKLPVGTDDEAVPVVYWIATRLDRNGNHRIDLVPSTVDPGTGQHMGFGSSVADQVGGGTALLSRGLSGATEIEKTLQAVDRLHNSDLTKARNLPDTFTQRYIRYAVCQATIVSNTKEFIGRFLEDEINVDPGSTPNNVYFGALGTPYWINDLQQRKAIGIAVVQAGSTIYTGTNSMKKWTGKGYFSDTAGDLTGNKSTTRSEFEMGPAGMSGSGQLLLAAVTNFTYETSGSFEDNFSQIHYCKIDDKPTTVNLTLIAMLTDKPIIAAINTLVRDSTETDSSSDYTTPPIYGNDYVQWVDPTANLYDPRLYNTGIMTDVSSPYTERWAATTPQAKQTCWSRCPVFIYGTAATNLVSGATSTGFLKGRTVYEYAYSIYNDLTGKESNVGVPAKAFVDEDGKAIRVQESYHNIAFSSITTAKTMFPPLNQIFEELGSAASVYIPVNFLSYRLYYRELGSFEWLFAGEHSFAKVYFEAFGEDILIGSITAVGPVGGQPGGINDYSNLPVDTYLDVTNFEGRYFWMSEGIVRYSRYNDRFNYPVNNYVECPAGRYLGMIPHFFAGQANQNGRLVFFTSEGTLDGVFTGIFEEQQVRVSATAQPQPVPIDGSDFYVRVRGSDTAFSGRAAVVAEGIFYFMGPTGIFRDDGVELPRKISEAIEPMYFETYQQNATDQFFAYFNKRSREILFFYRPVENTDTNPDGYLTKAWVYSLRTEKWSQRIPGAFTQYGYKTLIDWAQDFDVAGFSAEEVGTGPRTMIGVTGDAPIEGVSRAYYHDDACKGGDFAPGLETMIYRIERMDTDTVRFYFKTDYDDTAIVAAFTAGGVAIGTQIAIQLSTDYGKRAVADSLDGYYTITALNTVTDNFYVEVAATEFTNPPVGITNTQDYFPIFFAGVHDIKSIIDTEYLSPEGILKWNLFRYTQLLVDPVRKGQGLVDPTLNVLWQANHEIGDSPLSKNLPIVPLNSREKTTQLLIDQPDKQMQCEGQAVQITTDYRQLAGRWTLHMLIGYYKNDGDKQLKHYQRPEEH